MKIIPGFKDDTDKIIAISMAICTVFVSFFSPLIVILFLKERISEQSYSITKAFLNYEIFLALISLIAIVPIIGWIVGLFLIPVLYIWNIVVVLLAVCAMVKQNEVSVPVLYTFI